MPKKTPQFLEYFLEDCLNGELCFTKKNMFGGYALYKNSKVFSLFINDVIYFKVGDNNRSDYEDKDSKPFSYEKKNGVVGVMAYRELPEEVMENREELDLWIEKSLTVKSKTKAKKKSKKDRDLDRRILEALLQIPQGKVSTYKILADKFGVHSRRIASVMKHNKEPDVYPCYKIISHSGKMFGYSGPAGTDAKYKTLESEGIKIVDGKIDTKYYYTF